MQRIAVGLEYHGAQLSGFQKQASTDNTVQAHLEAALSRIANEQITLICAGRTDAGVHASEQVVHFDTQAQRPAKAWVQGTNTHLPDTLRVHWASPVPAEFHARFSATARMYRYIIHRSPTRSAVLNKSVTWVAHELDVQRMNDAAQHLLGEHDFSSFRSSQCQANSPVRTVHHLRFSENDQFIVMEIKANAFLHHMVRNIMGCLIDIGRGAKPVAWMSELLTACDRRLASPTARPWGLYLVKVDYPAFFHLPSLPLGPPFLDSRFFSHFPS